MKLLLVHSGCAASTGDVWRGLHDAMQRQNVDLVEYALDGRLEATAHYLEGAWERTKRQAPKPTAVDVVYQASNGSLERALRHDVDWVFVVSAMYFHPDTMIMLRRAGRRVACLFTESPYEDKSQLKYVPYLDAIWVNERASLDKFRALNPATFYYQHAIDPLRHPAGAQPSDDLVPAHDVVFVGTGWWERCELLSQTDWTGIDFGLYGAWSLLGSRAKLRQHIRGGIMPNARTAALYRRAKLGLNLHRSSLSYDRHATQITGAESLGPRCYELAAAGLPFVTDYRAEVTDVFGDLVPTFTNGSELRDVLDGFLHDPARRARIAHELPGCVAGHTFDARVTEILRTLKEV